MPSKSIENLCTLIAHGRFREARQVFEFGCGTDRFTARLLAEYLPAQATYPGCGLSPVMIGLSSKRLEAYSPRARVIQVEGQVHFPLPDHSVDRVLSSYVRDLLFPEAPSLFFAEARRTLEPGDGCVWPA